MRWLQAAIFSAHLRFHGIGQREPWSYGAQAEQAAHEALALREKLRPYLEKTVKDAALSGLPVQRAMVLAFPDEPQSWAFENQFMCGPDILAAPCIRPDGKVPFYLPHGNWKHLTSGTDYQGGRHYNLTFNLDEIACFIKDDVEIDK